MRHSVYLDHNATTPVDPVVLAAMEPFWRDTAANPSSLHAAGQRARQAVERAREQVAALVGSEPKQVVFTSGGSEANNLFIRGAAAMRPPGRIAISAGEHACVRRPARSLVRQGWQLVDIALDAEGRICRRSLADAAAGGLALASFIAAHNETGVLQDIAALAAQARAAGAWVHSDAAQLAGKLPLDLRELGVDALTLSAHKLYGPKGVGALVLGKRIDVRPQIEGGGHEHGLRAGTENVPAIVGFGAACELAQVRLAAESQRQQALRDRLVVGLQESALGAVVFGADAPRLPNTVFLAVEGLDGPLLVQALDEAGFSVGNGSACSSSDSGPSPTLLAMGVDPALARGAVRVSIGRDTTAEQIDQLLLALPRVCTGMRSLAAVAV